MVSIRRLSRTMPESTSPGSQSQRCERSRSRSVWLRGSVAHFLLPAIQAGRLAGLVRDLGKIIGIPESGRGFRHGRRRLGEPALMAAARSIGADHVIDYTRVDFTRSGQRYVQTLQVLLPAPFLSRIGNREMGSSLAKTNHKDLVFLRDLLEAREVVPVFDRRDAKRRC